MESSAVTETESSVEIKPKMHFAGKVMKISLAGAAIDIGQAKPAVLHVSQIIAPSEEPIMRVSDVLQIGQEVEVWVKRVKEDHVELTMIKPLDLEWRDLKKGMTVHGKVVRLEKFGAFVEIGAERPGLVHISEMAHGYVKQPSDIVKEEDEVEAQVLDVNRRKKQIKLSMKAITPKPEEKVEEIELPKTDRKGKGKRGKGYKQEMEHTDSSPAELEPTVFELAWQAALDRQQAKRAEKKGSKVKSSKEQDEILNRTLEKRLPTGG